MEFEATMIQPSPASAPLPPATSVPSGFVPAKAAIDYIVDAWQRGILFADVMRERGNQYQAHLLERAPNVLDFGTELVVDGRTLPRPVNYGLVRITAPDDLKPDRDATGAHDPGRLRPFIVFDPRAGHGPGIGGFKRDSEIGAALRAGHPCYFVGFLPDPVPGQTVEDVMRAEATFLEKVIELHPDSPGKPAVIGNCQAGWQVLMTAAMRPELFGPIIVAGAPVSYWAGWRGKNPMRYSGGTLGGSWLTALTGDLGDGRFDGAWLVQNFETLNPANTLWQKQYNLYTNIDSEASRYLGFEKYWGGHVFLNAGEMQYIVDNLFVGNRLVRGEIVTSDGIRLDLRNIRSPIVVFCSYGDNITPPPQALGWITDLYRDDADLFGHDQTIVYATHDSIGHLGIFVSSSTGKKEHREFVSNVDLIDLLPSGLYEAHMGKRTDATPHAELVEGEHVLSISRRGIDDVRAIVQPDPESDRRFATAAYVSSVNLGLYRNFMQPWVHACVTPWAADVASRVHPLRVPYASWSDRNPLASSVARLAEDVKEARTSVAADNPFWQMQNAMSDAIGASLDFYRDTRDTAVEQLFEAVYGMPWLQAMAGLPPRSADERADESAAPLTEPGDSEARSASIAAAHKHLRDDMTKGGLIEASVRALLFVRRTHGEADERRFNLAREMLSTLSDRGILAFKEVVREQAALLRLDVDAAIDALPGMLANAAPADIRNAARHIDTLTTTLPLDDVERADLARVLSIFESASKTKTKSTRRAETRQQVE
ncbi:PHB de-polymerase domain-containing protein [Caballeronia telluris]|uniref:PHB de-polymerase domain-containing protein n=2 Tax=Caballeronia telluris TaxID=326475 RepID=A0A158G9R0_9BURK|nr:PHB de-polymerase domain-containing protein [Caballeronia telluris]